MKHLLSLVAALAVTAVLALMFPGVAAAQNFASAVNGTCTGTNPDGTTATWTMNGQIAYNSAYGAHFSDGNGNVLGYQNISPNDVFAPPFGGGSCSWSTRTSGDIKPNCAGLTGKVFIKYTVYPGYGGTETLSNWVGGAYVPPNYEYNPISGWGFNALSDIKNAQYKVTSLQGGSLTTWETATSYL